MSRAAVVALFAAGVAAQRAEEPKRQRILNDMVARLYPPKTVQVCLGWGADAVHDALADSFRDNRAARRAALASRATWTLRATLVALEAEKDPPPATAGGHTAELDYLAAATRRGARPHALPPIRVANLGRATSATLRAGVGIAVTTMLDRNGIVHVAVHPAAGGEQAAEPLMLAVHEGSFAVGLLPGTGAQRWLVVMALDTTGG